MAVRRCETVPRADASRLSEPEGAVFQLLDGETLVLGRIASLLGVMAVLAATPADAKVLAFNADLRGDAPSSTTGSKATGHAKILVNTDTQTVDVALNVDGLKIDDLWTKLRNSPKGPIHLHIYGSHDHSGNAPAALIFPLPYGPSYVATEKGFKVDVKSAPYTAGAKLVQSDASFDEFVSSLQNGRLVLNIHTNANPAGEISGDVIPAK